MTGDRPTMHKVIEIFLTLGSFLAVIYSFIKTDIPWIIALYPIVFALFIFVGLTTYLGRNPDRKLLFGFILLFYLLLGFTVITPIIDGMFLAFDRSGNYDLSTSQKLLVAIVGAIGSVILTVFTEKRVKSLLQVDTLGEPVTH